MEELKQRITNTIYTRLIESEIDSLKTIILMTTVELQERAKISFTEAKSVLKEAAHILVNHKIKTGPCGIEWVNTNHKKITNITIWMNILPSCIAWKKTIGDFTLEIPPWIRIRTGCESIDSITNGGIATSGVTEIYGCSGVGKTQLCLQLAIAVQFPLSAGGREKGAVYICTEDIFPSKRLNMLSTLLPKRVSQPCTKSYEENIFIEHIADYEQMRRCLYVRLPNLLSKVPVGLIVIDSIAGAFRSGPQSINYVTRSEEIYSISCKLRELSTMYNLGVVCINQVTDDPNSGQCKPSLGQSWANLVTCRYEISRLSPESKIRVFTIVNSPDLEPKSCNFLITPSGLMNTCPEGL